MAFCFYLKSLLNFAGIFGDMTKITFEKDLLFKYIAIAIAICVLPLLEKGDAVLWVQSFHNDFLDLFFSRITVFGDATWTVLILLWIVFKSNYRWLGLLILAFVFHGLFVHLFKQWLANGAPRPFSYFTQRTEVDLLHLIEGVKIRKWNSFPSGHTATTFFMASYLMAYNGFSTASKWICYTLAVLVGLSRIYLGQHFYIDVIFGALFGIMAFDLALLIMGSAKKDYWNRSILKSRTK